MKQELSPPLNLQQSNNSS